MCVTWGLWKGQAELCLGVGHWEINTQEALKFWSFIFALFKAYCFLKVAFLVGCTVVLSRN